MSESFDAHANVNPQTSITRIPRQDLRKIGIWVSVEWIRLDSKKIGNAGRID
jgi:hypothetical protein